MAPNVHAPYHDDNARYRVRPPTDMNPYTLPFVVAVCVLASCGSGEAEPDDARSPAATEKMASDDTRPVETFLTGYYDALSDRDWVRFANSFHDGAHIAFVMPDSTGATGRVTFQSIPRFVQLAPLGPGSREIFEERMTDHTIHVSGDLAVAWVEYEARFGDPGDVMEWTGIDAVTMIRIRNAWKITSLAYVPEL